MEIKREIQSNHYLPMQNKNTFRILIFADIIYSKYCIFHYFTKHIIIIIVIGVSDFRSDFVGGVDL